MELITFNASNSVDFDGDKCKQFVFNFGDGSNTFHSTKPIVKYKYNKKGIYSVHVMVTDKYGNKSNASLQQKVIDDSSDDEEEYNDEMEKFNNKKAPYVAFQSI
eukprot:263322_1